MSFNLYLPRIISFTVTVGNHGATTRATYTVPAGQVAEIEHIYIKVRESAVTGFALANTNAQVNGIRIAQVITQAAIAERQDTLGEKIFLTSGDVVILQTINASAIVLVFEGAICIREYQ